jgi:protein MAK11
MAKRKRNGTSETTTAGAPTLNKKVKASPTSTQTSPITIQIIAGSYDRVLHGITATISSKNDVQFADTFLFDAHTSAIRTLALSPPSAPVPKQTQKIILATGSTDERINLFHVSAHAPSKITLPVIPSITKRPVVENAQNRELGSLLHHASSITALYFPNRSKLLSSAEDNTIAVTRTRDWSLLSTIKTPIPNQVGRPSGDTAPLGGAPSGVNDFAVHPSMKLMITVGKGEKSMRLWNLITGKKAGVLNFDRHMLTEVGEGRYAAGEGRKVRWGSTEAGDEFCVGFERGALVFGMDSKPRCKVVAEPRTKIHQMAYLQVGEEEDGQVLAVSTEDGRIIFYSTRSSDLSTGETVTGKEAPLPAAKLLAQVGGKAVTVKSTADGDKKAADVPLTTRIKDFKCLVVGAGKTKHFVIISASSDGNIRMWNVAPKDLVSHSGDVKQIGELLGTCETGNRITCIEAFVMLPPMEGAEDAIEDFEGFDDEESSGSDSDQ